MRGKLITLIMSLGLLAWIPTGEARCTFEAHVDYSIVDEDVFWDCPNPASTSDRYVLHVEVSGVREDVYACSNPNPDLCD